jgi:RNA polymerase sigma factor (sigma-70 family)
MDRLAFLLVGSRAVGDELVQDAFTRLYEHLDEVENPGGFVRVALVRLCSTARSRRDMERDRLYQLDRLADPPELGIPEVDETWDALSRLAPERRVVLVLRFYEDLTHAQIAELLDCPEATVRTRLHRGLADLREEIER